MLNLVDIEKEIIEFWRKNNIYEKAKKLVRGKESFYFLDGPPYTSGRVHIGTAWNKVLKDSILSLAPLQSGQARLDINLEISSFK